MYNFDWNYNPSDYNANVSSILAEGDYRVRISSAMPTVAKNGTHGLEIILNVNKSTNNLKHYIWFNPNDVQRTNQKLGQFFDSFDIKPTEQKSCAPGRDKNGAVHVVHSEYKGRTIAKVAYCIERDKQDKLPEWKDEASVLETRDITLKPPITPTKFTYWEDLHF